MVGETTLAMNVTVTDFKLCFSYLPVRKKSRVAIENKVPFDINIEQNQCRELQE